MTKEEAFKLLRGGEEGIIEWNRRRAAGDEIPSLANVDLSGADLSFCLLEGVDLSDAGLCGADLYGSGLIRADLRRADLDDAILRGVDLTGADLGNALLQYAAFIDCNIFGTGFADATWGWTTLVNMDLSETRGLDAARFNGPCSIGVDTLARSKGRIPESFLRGCGFQSWEVIQARIYDPALTREQFMDLQYKVFVVRNESPFSMGGVFISYSHEDSRFVDKIHGRLQDEGAPVWMDRHDLVAGDLQRQVSGAIRLNDVVLLVLSESSVNSDWVKYELEMVRKKEKEEQRDVLCPVALDDSWKKKMDDVLWRQVKKKNVLDFSKWETKAFDAAYQKLTAGLRVNYWPVPKDDLRRWRPREI